MENKKLIWISIITYLFGIIPSFIIIYPDFRTEPDFILMVLFSPIVAFGVVMLPVIAIYFSTIHKRFIKPQSQESYNAQLISIVITLIIGVICLWVYALIFGDFSHINVEYFLNIK